MTMGVFWLYTIVVGTIFAYALLWSIAQWLKGDEESVEAVRREERRKAA
ncbi:MAG: hypothetical protein ACE5JQ_11145 [Candidatus Methylomirabilales bacterium]